MTYEQFERLYAEMVVEEIDIGRTKGKEYTQGQDRLDNFKRIGLETDIDAKKALWIYLKKHLDSIAYYIKTGKSLSEPIESRIKDARVYLALLRGLIEEERPNGSR